jgi:hypothetical protein
MAGRSAGLAGRKVGVAFIGRIVGVMRRNARGHHAAGPAVPRGVAGKEMQALDSDPPGTSCCSAIRERGEPDPKR